MKMEKTEPSKMEAARTRRWSVTYTKHVKQKRKVYQDGILALDASGHKVMLYDDCEKLLDSRFVKLDDLVKAGETITFGAYLVDIGDPDGDSKPITILNFEETDAKVADKGGLLHGSDNTLKSNSTSMGNRKSSSSLHKTLLSKLSPSQKIIREFKKTEVKKYGTSASCLNTTKAKTTEWQVLYTSQLTKKAKTFHDGTLRLAIRGSQGRQVMLYDAMGGLLDSRFLKKDEMITCGESIRLDGHLVDVGECEGDHKLQADLDIQGRKCNGVQRGGLVHGEQSQTCSKSPAEWDAMYTTQTTQKTKKYHDGVIRFASCGSSRMQATLLAEDGTILSRRFLKISENLSSGHTFQLPNYLVEIGELRKQCKGEPQNGASMLKCKDVILESSGWDDIKSSRGLPANRHLWEPESIASPFQDTCSKVRSSGADKVVSGVEVLTNNSSRNGEPLDNASSFQDADFNVRSSGADRVISGGEVLKNKALRSAHAILSVLKKPHTVDGIANVKKQSVNEYRASESSEAVHHDTQHEVQGKSVQIPCRKRIKIEDLGEETSIMHNFNGEASRSKPIHIDDSVETIVSVDISSRGHGMDPLVSGALGLDSDVPPEPCDRSKGNEETGDPIEVTSCKGTSNMNFNPAPEIVKHGNPPQEPSRDYTETNSTWHDGALSFCRTTSTDHILPDNCDIARKISPEQRNTRVFNGCPSFDLGF